MPQSGLPPRWRTLNVLVVFLLLLGLILAAGSAAVFRSMTLEQDARARGREIAMVREDLSQILTHLNIAESAQRGYLLTGAEAYLSPYATARQETVGRLDHLASLGPQAPRQPAIAELRDLAAEKFAEMEETLALAHDGRAAEAQAIVATDRGRQIMDRIEAVSRHLIETEQRALDQSYTTVDRRQRSALLQVIVLTGGALGALLIAALSLRQTAHARAEAAWAAEIRAQRDRADLIRREMSHRVKNLFAVIMSIISTTARGETDVRAAARKTRDRVQALARAHSLSSGEDEMESATIGALVQAVAGPYRPEGQDLALEGPEIRLSAQIITPLGLILNELATNALKYGGWMTPAGTVRASWRLGSPNVLDFVWRETGITPRVTGQEGFGTTMIDLSAQQAGGTASRDWDGTVFTFRMQIPLVELPADRMDKVRAADRS